MFKSNKAQNLIQNGNFESYVNTSFCSNGDISVVNNWSSIASSDYYNSVCNNNYYGTPLNYFGNCNAFSGNGYAGLGVFNRSNELKEYLYQHLNSVLITGKTYYTSFYLSRSDKVTYSINNIGVYFTTAQPNSSFLYIAALPQIENQTGFLTDTIGWTKIEGYFKAQGGEEYMTIGNFNSNANTDTLYSGTTNPFNGDPGTAYYYIDSVSLYDSLDYALINNIKKNESDFNVKLYPNPTAGKLKIEIENLKEGNITIKITDILGREVKQLEYDASINSAGEKEIDVSALEKGIYFFSLHQNRQLIGTKKVVKQ